MLVILIKIGLRNLTPITNTIYGDMDVVKRSVVRSENYEDKDDSRE